MIRKEFTGMIPAAINKFEELLALSSGLNSKIVKGYDSATGQDSFFYWGVACQISADDMEILKSLAEGISITWMSNNGSMAFTNGLTIDDFKTYRVNGNLELMPEEEA